jgi:hypothetical protein
MKRLALTLVLFLGPSWLWAEDFPLYGIDNSTLWTVDKATGELTKVADLNPGISVSSLHYDWHHHHFYSFDGYSASFYAIVGADQRYGPTGETFGPYRATSDWTDQYGNHLFSPKAVAFCYWNNTFYGIGTSATSTAVHFMEINPYGWTVTQASDGVWSGHPQFRTGTFDDWTGDILFGVVGEPGALGSPTGLYFNGNVNLGTGLASSFTADLSAYTIESMTVDYETSDLYFVGYQVSGPITRSLYHVERATGTVTLVSTVPYLAIAFGE